MQDNKPLFSAMDALQSWYRVVTRTLRTSNHDLSSRQMGILLTVYLSPPPHTIKNLSEQLRISKPAVCRAIDALSKEGFVRRKKDEEDKRNVYLQRTVKGSVFLSEFADTIASEMYPMAETSQSRQPIAA